MRSHQTLWALSILTALLGIVTLVTLNESSTVPSELSIDSPVEYPGFDAIEADIEDVRQRSSDISKHINGIKTGVLSDQADNPRLHSLERLEQITGCLSANLDCENGDTFAAFKVLSELHGRVLKQDEERVAQLLYQLALVSTPLATASIDMARSFSNESYLTGFFELENLSAEAKAHLIESSAYIDSESLVERAEGLLRKMIDKGSVSEVFAAIDKIVHFPELESDEIRQMQQSICRFDDFESGSFEFEMIQIKWSRIFKHSPIATMGCS